MWSFNSEQQQCVELTETEKLVKRSKTVSSSGACYKISSVDNVAIHHADMHRIGSFQVNQTEITLSITAVHVVSFLM